MEYNPETGFNILKAMENYKGSTVPSPLTELDENTGLPPATTPPPRKLVSASGDAEEFSRRVSQDLRERLRRPQTPERTAPKSWIGEMDYAVFMAHVNWMKQERLITTSDSSGYPRELAIKGVQLLKEVEAKGGWGKAMEIVAEAKTATTLTSISEVLRKAKPKN